MKSLFSRIRFRVVLEVAFILVVALHGATPPSTNARRIEIVAKRFEFAPSQITLKKGEPVVLAFRTDDVEHSIAIGGINIRTDIKQGHASEVRITPQTTGDFIGKCANFCGSGHGRMLLAVHVK